MKKNTQFLLSVILSCIPLFLSFNRGINYFDEGYILEGARRIMDGELPYKDFHFIYTPGTIYYLSLFFRIFGQSIIIERIAAMVMSIIGIVFLGLLIQRQTKNNILTVLAMFMYSIWGPVHINFLWPVMIVIPLIFVFFYLFFKSNYIFAGLIAALVLLCKHNFGAALFLALIVYFFFSRPTRRTIDMLCFGFCMGIVIFFAYLISTGAFHYFFSDMYTYTVQEVLVQKSFSAPFPNQSIGKLFLYLFPGLISFSIGLGLVMRKETKKLLLVPVTFFFIYLFGIFPTPDWTHLTPLLSISAILIVYIPQIGGTRFRLLSYIFFIGMISIGVYSAIKRNYYRWEAPLVQHTHCNATERMRHICIDEKNYAVITQTIPHIMKGNNVYSIFSFYNNPIIYFLTNKKNPTPFIDFNVRISEIKQRRVLAELKKKNVTMIITRFPPKNNQSILIGRYIMENYRQIHSVYEFTVWKRK